MKIKEQAKLKVKVTGRLSRYKSWPRALTAYKASYKSCSKGSLGGTSYPNSTNYDARVSHPRARLTLTRLIGKITNLTRRTKCLN